MSAEEVSERKSFHHTVIADGTSARWELTGTKIRILSVMRPPKSDPLILLDQPDLAEARERFPRLTDLWDAIRHEFWATYKPSKKTAPL
ncbi:hypothetical protein ACFYTQ_05720 [Nocardia sp. NPDC004068]|uniref:hypothetical protein n=1 Tax=Nocardia sp. NPDC004068 TaxID=3364303 RepID=UPI0036CC65F3